jgi:hypothetical protein
MSTFIVTGHENYRRTAIAINGNPHLPTPQKNNYGTKTMWKLEADIYVIGGRQHGLIG